METNDIVMSGVQLKKLISKKAEPVMEEYDLRSEELDILVFLHNEKNVDTAKGIIERKHLSKAHISKSIDNLRTGGFIQITEDEEDHRVLHIRLTDKSNEVIRKMSGVYAECRDIMMNGISEEELNIVKTILRHMNENVNRALGE